MRLLRPTRAGCMLAAAIAILLLAASRATCQPADPAADRLRAVDLAANLDFDSALALLRGAAERAPEHAAVHRSLAAVLWQQMLFQRGAVTVDHYLGSLSRARVALEQPPPELDAEFKRHVSLAVELAERQLAARPDDPQAMYDLGAAVGLHASHVATVQGRLLAGFRAARRSYDLHERVLRVDPAFHDAKLVVGMYRYIVSTLSTPMRLLAYVAGFGGGRERGIEMLKEAAAQGREARTDALFALALVYNREQQFDSALAVLGELGRRYPGNRLVVLESGSTALRAGRHVEAERILTQGLAMTERDARARFPGEAELWRYKRGAARRGAGQTQTALEDLRIASGPGAQAWVAGRARVELAHFSLAQGDRKAAARQAGEAAALCDRGNDAPCVAEARQILRSANGR